MYFASVSPNIEDQSEIYEQAIAILEYPSLSVLVEFVLSGEESRWNELKGELRKQNNSDSFAEAFCSSRWRPTYEFWTVELDRTCLGQED